MRLLRLPELVIHADWGIAPGKRWQAVGELRDGSYVISAPTPAMNPVEEALRSGRTALVGFDFPIGIPRAYAAKAGVESFLDLLPQLGWREWRDCFRPADAPEEISVYRPFYPGVSRKGSAHQHLLDGLGVRSMNELRRVCDAGHATRGPAEALFWTLGPKQVGEAAISGWRDVLVPARREIRIWPFEGTLGELLDAGGVVVCETYPAEFYGHFGIGAAKAAIAARALAAPQLAAACRHLGLELDARLQPQVEMGFATDDAYDAFVGLIGMINVLMGNRSEAPSLDAEVLQIEGWIFAAVGEDGRRAVLVDDLGVL